MKGKKVVIIGSGVGGICAGALLAKHGFAVEIYEKNEQPGGRASVLQENGFTFDMGPSWFMMPDVFEKFFAQAGDGEGLRALGLTRLDPSYKVFFEDKVSLAVPSSAQKAAALFESMEKGAGEKFKAYLADSQKKYNVAMTSVLYKNMDTILGLASREVAAYANIAKIFLPIHTIISDYFKNDKIQQILEYNLVFLGCSPQNAPGIFSMMAHVDFNLGIWYPQGGITTVIQHMVAIAKKNGVKFHFHSPVENILVQNGMATSIVAAGREIPADYVVSNADYKFTEDLLSDQTKRNIPPKAWSKKVFAPSAFIIYLGVKGKTPHLLHHNLYFTKDWRPHFTSIFDSPNWPVHPSVYINNPSYSDSSLAPKGHEALMILVPVANGLPENDSWRRYYADYIIEYLDQKMEINLAKRIVYKKIFSVHDFETRYNSYKGNALGGLAHTLFQSAIWRPSNRSKHIRNLFFVGAGTVPGIGVPTSIISAHLVCDRVLKSL
jgi:phytoene desaturase